MNQRLIFALAVAAIVLVAGGLLVALLPAAPASTVSQPAATFARGASYVNTDVKLELRLSVNASYTGGTHGSVAVEMKADEFNTLTSQNDVPKAGLWAMSGLSLGSCGTGTYPFGVALYAGTYTAVNVSQAAPLQIYPVVPCPALTRLITGYLFQPGSDLAEILPASSNTTVTLSTQLADVTATNLYGKGPTLTIGPGNYTVAAGDEWGSVVTVHFTFGNNTSSAVAGTPAAIGPQLALLSGGLATSPVLALVALRAKSRTFQ